MRPMRALAAMGAFACSIAVGLGAYTMHATLAPQNHERLAIAALFLFAHGLALAALAPGATARVRQAGLCVLMFGAILFAGSLACAALLGVEPVLAPFGGSTLILGWLVIAAGFVLS
ncbi:MAG TPA: DUF423 domain-containing protein [Xanthomonadaceae bacterium]|nr:DUF423 domain-containing protein [Xanthomonadaceae bacterium]